MASGVGVFCFLILLYTSSRCIVMSRGAVMPSRTSFSVLLKTVISILSPMIMFSVGLRLRISIISPPRLLFCFPIMIKLQNDGNYHNLRYYFNTVKFDKSSNFYLINC